MICTTCGQDLGSGQPPHQCIEVVAGGKSGIVSPSEVATAARLANARDAKRAKAMKRAFVISPYAGDTARNVKYALKCMHFCWSSGFAPFASHIHYPASGALDDNDPKDREFGILSGQSFLTVCEVAFCFMDLHVSTGMRSDLDAAVHFEVPIRYVSVLGGVVTSDALHAMMLPHSHMPCAACQIEAEKK